MNTSTQKQRDETRATSNLQNFANSQGMSRRKRLARMLRHGGIRCHGYARNRVNPEDNGKATLFGRSCHFNVRAQVLTFLQRTAQRLASQSVVVGG